MSVDLRDKLETKIVEINVGKHKLQIKMATNLDELLEYVEDEDDIPFWAELWPSSIVLANFLQNQSLNGKELIELGAGLGLSGIGASLAGANVVQTDFIPLALELSQENARLNNTDSIEYMLVDWRNFEVNKQYDLVIGSDILYESKLHDCLLDDIGLLLKPDGKVFLTDPGREPAKKFIEKVQAKGFKIVKDRQEILWQQRIYNIDIYCLSKSFRGQT